ARHQADRLLGARCGAQTALHAVALDEAQERRFGRIKERRLRASADARLAQRAGLLVDLEGTERRPGRERDLLKRASLGEMLDGEVEAGALLRRKVEGGRLLHPARR